MSKDLEIDDKTLQAVSSDTRKEILKSLKERNMTVTELSKRLDLSKSTVHEHLSKLLDAEFVRKLDEEGKKWVYYELTDKGKKLVGNRVKKVLLFIISGIASIFGVQQVIKYLNKSGGYLKEEKSIGIQQTADTVPRVANTATKVSNDKIHLIIAAVLFATAASLLLYYWKKMK